MFSLKNINTWLPLSAAFLVILVILLILGWAVTVGNANSEERDIESCSKMHHQFHADTKSIMQELRNQASSRDEGHQKVLKSLRKEHQALHRAMREKKSCLSVSLPLSRSVSSIAMPSSGSTSALPAEGFSSTSAVPSPFTAVPSVSPSSPSWDGSPPPSVPSPSISSSHSSTVSTSSGTLRSSTSASSSSASSSASSLSSSSSDKLGPWLTNVSLSPTSGPPGTVFTFTASAEDPAGLVRIIYDIAYPNSSYVLRPNCNFAGSTSETCTISEAIDVGQSPAVLGEYKITIRLLDALHNVSTFYQNGTAVNSNESTHTIPIPSILIQ